LKTRAKCDRNNPADRQSIKKTGKMTIESKEPQHHLDDDDDIVYPASIPFALVHLACIAAIWSGITWFAVILCAALYWLRIFAIGAGYHRYFSHRAYSTSRAFQFILAFLAQSTAQKSVLWWAAKHRHHHLHSDTKQDIHSPRQKGFLYSHVGWILSRRHDTTDLVKVADLSRYPELMWLHKYHLFPAVILAVLCWVIAGWPGLVVGFFWSTVLVYHVTFCINSLAHIHGRKRFVTGDDSRNNWFLALLTMGEGWHNNHHACQSSVRQGFRWWEIDLTFYLLTALAWLGVIWDLKAPPQQLLRHEQPVGARALKRASEQLAASFSSDGIALAIMATLHAPELDALREAISRAKDRMSEVLTAWHLPELPRREDLMGEARAMFARTPSLDEIVDRAHAMILESVGIRLLSHDLA
jgi:stearoyl-CoA desaturase (delta-9 desaturase)